MLKLVYSIFNAIRDSAVEFILMLMGMMYVLLCIFRANIIALGAITLVFLASFFYKKYFVKFIRTEKGLRKNTMMDNFMTAAAFLMLLNQMFPGIKYIYVPFDLPVEQLLLVTGIYFITYTFLFLGIPSILCFIFKVSAENEQGRMMVTLLTIVFIFLLGAGTKFGNTLSYIVKESVKYPWLAYVVFGTPWILAFQKLFPFNQRGVKLIKN